MQVTFFCKAFVALQTPSPTLAAPSTPSFFTAPFPAASSQAPLPYPPGLKHLEEPLYIEFRMNYATPLRFYALRLLAIQPATYRRQVYRRVKPGTNRVFFRHFT